MKKITFFILLTFLIFQKSNAEYLFDYYKWLTDNNQTQFLWTIKFRGLGDLGTRGKGKFLHRDFEDTSFPNTIN